MIYDCFIFNDELELLQLRLRLLNNVADRFVLVESERTLAGNPKPLHFSNNKKQFDPFLARIIHVVAPFNNLPAWEYEYFLRNNIKTALTGCNPDDIIVISDADEMVNLEAVLSIPRLQLPAIAELPMNYYFFNQRTNANFRVNLIAPWSFLADKDLGPRNEQYPAYAKTIISSKTICTGWHFSYLYGFDIEKYQQKIKAFSHQELNTPFYLNPGRIRRCVLLGIDVFERPQMRLWIDNRHVQPLLPLMEELGLTKYLKPPSSWRDYLSVKNIWFILHSKYYRRVKHYIKQFFIKETDH